MNLIDSIRDWYNNEARKSIFDLIKRILYDTQYEVSSERQIYLKHLTDIAAKFDNENCIIMLFNLFQISHN